MRLRLIENAGRDFHRLWSIRISLAFGVFTGIASALGAFVGVFNPWVLLAVSVVVNVALIPLSRLVKQEEAKKGRRK